MDLELHHVFILVKPRGEVAELLSSIGMREGTRNKHEGQGTSNWITQRLIKNGMSGLNTDTDFRLAGLKAMMESLAAGPKVDLRPPMMDLYKSIYFMTARKLEQFGAIGKKPEILKFHKAKT